MLDTQSSTVPAMVSGHDFAAQVGLAPTSIAPWVQRVHLRQQVLWVSMIRLACDAIDRSPAAAKLYGISDRDAFLRAAKSDCPALIRKSCYPFRFIRPLTEIVTHGPTVVEREYATALDRTVLERVRIAQSSYLTDLRSLLVDADNYGTALMCGLFAGEAQTLCSISISDIADIVVRGPYAMRPSTTLEAVIHSDTKLPRRELLRRVAADLDVRPRF